MNSSENENCNELPLLGTVEHVKANLWVVKKGVAAGQTYAVNCPGCQKTLTTNPEGNGTVKLKCDNCGATIGYNSYDATRIVPVDGKERKGMLQWGKCFSRHRAELKMGINIVGRADKGQPSDICIDDSTVSRQSVCINVTFDQKKRNHLFQLTVQHAKNEVLVNGMQLQPGQGLFLESGDKIKLGNTIIVFTSK